MAHFAELDENNIVLRVIVVANEELLDEQEIEREKLGKNFLINLLGPGRRWVQTSYNNRIRGKYAGIGDSYDTNRNSFARE